MIRQGLILFFLIVFLVVTLYLYMWKAKKEMVYRKDERWKIIQSKALINANYLTYGLILVIAVMSLITTFQDINMNFTLNNLLLIALFYLGVNNAIELGSLLYFDKRM